MNNNEKIANWNNVFIPSILALVILNSTVRHIDIYPFIISLIALIIYLIYAARQI